MLVYPKNSTLNISCKDLLTSEFLVLTTPCRDRTKWTGILSAYLTYLLSVEHIFSDSILAAFKWLLIFFDSGSPETKSDSRLNKRPAKKNKSVELKRDANFPEGICCAKCHAFITQAKNAIAVEGQHQHRVTNPMGTTFNIGTYSKAECKVESETVSEYSWFAGYAWRIIACPECSQHIGWSYEKGRSPDFYGLIVDKLIDFDK